MRRGFLKFLISLLLAWFSLQGYTALAMPLCLHADANMMQVTHDSTHSMHHGDHESEKSAATSCDNCTFCQLCTVSAMSVTGILFATDLAVRGEAFPDIFFHSYTPPHLSPPPLV